MIKTMACSVFSRLLICGSLLSVAQIAHAQVVLRCGTGTVSTAGFHINNIGEVVFSEPEIICGDVQTGPGLPDALQLALVSPPVNHTINVANQAVVVPFSATMTNYTAGVDACQATVTPAIAGTPVALTPSNGQATATLNFPQGQAAGTYNVGLNCTRQANGQQVVVNNPAAHAVIVQNGGTNPTQCQNYPIPSLFNPVVQRNYTDTHSSEGGWGAQPNVNTTWRTWYFTRNPSAGGTLTATKLRTWKLRPTANSRVMIVKGGHGGAQYVMSISECPGDFRQTLGNCRTQTSLVWHTNGAGTNSECALDTTKDYYLNIAVFDRDHFDSTGQYRSTIACTNSQGCDVQLGVQRLN